MRQKGASLEDKSVIKTSGRHSVCSDRVLFVALLSLHYAQEVYFTGNLARKSYAAF